MPDMDDRSALAPAPIRSLVGETLDRAVPQGLSVERSADGESTKLRGHFSVFNTWTLIDSAYEGTFLERFAPGAFKKTFEESSGKRDKIKVLFQHGRDPQVGKKPIGSIAALREDETGAYYEVDLFGDASYVRDLIPALRSNTYGASFQFQVVREDVNFDPEPSDYNPEGLPERTVTEAKVYEFGPVTFPAYDDATAGMRSQTDERIVAQLGGPAEMRSLADEMERRALLTADGAALIAAVREARDQPLTSGDVPGQQADPTSAPTGDEAPSEPTPGEEVTAPSEAAAAPEGTADDERRSKQAPQAIRPRRFTT